MPNPAGHRAALYQLTRGCTTRLRVSSLKGKQVGYRVQALIGSAAQNCAGEGTGDSSDEIRRLLLDIITRISQATSLAGRGVVARESLPRIGRVKLPLSAKKPLGLDLFRLEPRGKCLLRLWNRSSFFTRIISGTPSMRSTDTTNLWPNSEARRRPSSWPEATTSEPRAPPP